MVVDKTKVEQKWLSNPVFVLGYPKSGTSLLVGILDNHPELVVVPEETDYFENLYQYVGMIEGNDRISKAYKIDSICDIICESTHLRNFNKGHVENDIGGNFNYQDFDGNKFREHIKEYLSKRTVNTKNALLAIPYAFWKVSDLHYTGIQGWVEKTPYLKKNIHKRFDLVKEMFENGKTIHIVRDPRDNYLAYKKKWPNLGVTEFCFEWKKIYTIIKKVEVESDNLTIQYEELVSYPENMTKRVSSFLGVEYSENLKVPSKYGHPWHGNSMFGEKHKGISNKNLGRFRNLSDQTDIARIEYHLKKSMLEMGYMPEIKPLSLLMQVKEQAHYQLIYLQKGLESLAMKFKSILTSIFYKYRGDQERV